MQNQFILVPQANFENVTTEDGTYVRADAYVFCPSDENVRIVLECDGFKYHGDKASFDARSAERSANC